MPFSPLEENITKKLNRYVLKLGQLTLAGDTGLSCAKFLELWVARQLALWKEIRAQIQNRESQPPLFALIGSSELKSFALWEEWPQRPWHYTFTSPSIHLPAKCPLWPNLLPAAPRDPWSLKGPWVGTQGIMAEALGCTPTALLPRKWGWSCLLSEVNECSQNSVCRVGTERLPQLRDEREQITMTQLYSSQKHCHWTSICFTEVVKGCTMKSAQGWLHFGS